MAHVLAGIPLGNTGPKLYPVTVIVISLRVRVRIIVRKLGR